MTSGRAKKINKKKRPLDYCSTLADDLYAALMPTNLRLRVFFNFYYALDTFPVHQCGLGPAINHRMLALPPPANVDMKKNEQSAAISYFQRLITQDATGPSRREWLFVGVNSLVHSNQIQFCPFAFRGRRPVLEGVLDVGFGVDELLSALLSSVLVRLGGTGLVLLE